jgi:hypothetical protein
MGVTETGLTPNPFVSRGARNPNPFDGVLSDEALDDGPDGPLSPNHQAGEARAAAPLTTGGNITELNFTDEEVDVVEPQPEGTEAASQGSEGFALIEAMRRQEVIGIDWSSLSESTSLTELLDAEDSSGTYGRSAAEARQEGGIPAPYIDIQINDPDLSLRPRQQNPEAVPTVDTVVDMDFSGEDPVALEEGPDLTNPVY